MNARATRLQYHARRNAGLCTVCGGPSDTGLTRCEECAEYLRERTLAPGAEYAAELPTLRDVGAQLGISHEMVRIIQDRAIAKVAHGLGLPRRDAMLALARLGIATLDGAA